MNLNQISRRVRPQVSIFLEAVNTHFSFLEDLGYAFKEERLATQYVVEDIVEVLYKNENIDRAIIIHYEPAGNEDEPIDLIDLSLYKGINHGTTELTLEKYINKYYPKLDINPFMYPAENEKATLKENMDIAVAGFAHLLKTAAAGLVNGSEWEDGLIYDVSAAYCFLYKEQQRLLNDVKDMD